jgi:hypothetical protein
VPDGASTKAGRDAGKPPIEFLSWGGEEKRGVRTDVETMGTGGIPEV